MGTALGELQSEAGLAFEGIRREKLERKVPQEVVFTTAVPLEIMCTKGTVWQRMLFSIAHMHPSIRGLDTGSCEGKWGLPPLNQQTTRHLTTKQGGWWIRGFVGNQGLASL